MGNSAFFKTTLFFELTHFSFAEKRVNNDLARARVSVWSCLVRTTRDHRGYTSQKLWSSRDFYGIVWLHGCVKLVPKGPILDGIKRSHFNLVTNGFVCFFFLSALSNQK